MSDAWWAALLSNTLIAAGLGVVGWVVAHPLRRPALAHSLFVLALLKLVTPPLFAVGVWPVAMAPAGTVTIHAPAEPNDSMVGEASAPQRGSQSTAVGSVPGAASSEPGTTAPPVVGGAFAFGCSDLAVGGWLSGSVLVGIVLLHRAWRFRGVLQLARRADATLLAEVHAAQRQVGLRRAPRVLVGDADLPPIVFAGWRGVTLLVPAAIVGRVDVDARIALWRHELAHVRRGDVWLRWFEAALRAALWWHPLGWWLSRQLHDAEERVCDAWATAGLAPAQRRSYCDALLMVASDCSAPVPIPASPAARRIGRRLRTWQLRLEDVMTREHAIGSRPVGRLAVLLVAAAALPLALAQQPADPQAVLAARLDRIEIRFRSENEPLSAWSARLAELAGLDIVVEPSATAVDPGVTTLRDLQLPRTSVRRVLDVITALTDVSWSQAGGVISLRARAAVTSAPSQSLQASGSSRTGIRCYGAFVEPGLVELGAGETVLSLLARMPVTKDADLGAVRVVRTAGAETLALVVDVDGMLRSGVTTNNLSLAAGDSVVVAERLPDDLPPLTLRPGARVRFVIDPAVLEQPGAEQLGLLREFQRVQRDGTIFVPWVGPVPVDGLLRDEVSELVQRRLLETVKFQVQVWARLD